MENLRKMVGILRMMMTVKSLKSKKPLSSLRAKEMYPEASKKDGSSGAAKISLCSLKSLPENNLRNPVLLQAKFITGPYGSRAGAIFDLGSMDNYVHYSQLC